MNRKVLALLLSLLLSVGLCSAAFADGLASPDLIGADNAAFEFPAATEGQTAPPPEAPSESEAESESFEASQDEPEESITESSPEESESSEGIDGPENESVSSEDDESSRDEPESSEDPEAPEISEPSESELNEPEDSDAVIDDIPYIPADRGDVFAVRSLLRVPEVHSDAPSTQIGNDKSISDINTGGGKWIPDRGIPDVEGATISSSTSLVFAIPDDNFTTATNGTTSTFDAKLTALNTAANKNKVKVLKPNSNNVTGNFDIQFVGVSATGSGRAFGVQLTPKNIPAEGLELPTGTSFGFDGQANAYTLRNDLLIVPNRSGSKATGINPYAELGYGYTWVTLNGSVYNDRFDEIDAMAGDELLIHFSPQFFTWKDDIIPAKVTLTGIRSKISLRQTGTSGSRVFEAVELTTSKSEAVVRVKFRDDLISTKPMDFKTTLTLAVSGKRDENSSLEIIGTFGDVEPEDFYSEDREIDISDGLIGFAAESMSAVKVYIGGGVTLTVPHIRKNAKFYGTVSTSFDKYDEELMELYPDIVEVYRLHTLGLNGAGVKVDIDTYNGLHVYDADLNYLGQSTRRLDYSDTYYLAENMLDIETLEEEEEYEPVDGDVPPSKNTNKNPGTGK